MKYRHKPALLIVDIATPGTLGQSDTNKDDDEEKKKTNTRKEPEKLHKNLKLVCRMFPPNMPLETTEWLNVLLKQFVQQQHKKDINARLMESLNKEFVNLEEKSKILSYIYASQLSVGDTPPELKSIKILPSDASKRDLEYSARMVYNGGFTMELHTQIQLYSFVEAHLKVSVVDCFGDVNIRITNVPDAPGDFYLYFMLSEDPQIRLDIQSVLGTFTDLAMIDQIVTQTLKLVIRSLFVDPNGRKYRWGPNTGFVLEKITPDEKKMFVEIKKKKKKNLGPVTGRLHFHVHEAEGLLGRETGNHLHDPYCVVSFNRQLKKTKVIPKMLNPKWDEHFVFDVFDHQDYVIVSVYDRDRLGKDEFLGHCMIVFGSLPVNEKINYVQILKRRKKPEEAGTIRFEMMFEPFEQNRTVIYSREKSLAQFDRAFIDIFDNDGNRKNSAEFVEAALVASAAKKFKNSIEKINSLKSIDSSSETTRSLTQTGSFRSGLEVMELFSSADKPRPLSKDLSKSSDALLNFGKRPEMKYVLKVMVIQAQGLMACDKAGTSDPYALISVGKASKRTRVMKNSLSPFWNEILVFPLSQLPESVVVELFDWNRIYTHKFMGEAVVDLKDAVVDGDTVKHNCLGKSLNIPLGNVQTSDKNAKPDPDIVGEIEIMLQLETFKPENENLLPPSAANDILLEDQEVDETKAMQSGSEEDLLAGKDPIDIFSTEESLSDPSAVPLSAESDAGSVVSDPGSAQALAAKMKLLNMKESAKALTNNFKQYLAKKKNDYQQ